MIEVQNISKKIDEQEILKDISFVIPPQQTLVIAGANGSGKSMLTKIILDLVEPSNGCVLLDGIANNQNAKFRQQVGLVFQDADSQIIGATVLEDVMFGLLNLKYHIKDAEQMALDILAKVNLLDKKDCIPLVLSGGEKRRLSIASIAVVKPKYLFLDEPYANLDWRSICEINRILIELQKTTALIIVTHELEKVLALANQMLVLNQGQLVICDEPCAALGQLKDEFNVKNPFTNYKQIQDLIWL
jgi:biotin transport system ATP-binding protein